MTYYRDIYWCKQKHAGEMQWDKFLHTGDVFCFQRLVDNYSTDSSEVMKMTFKVSSKTTILGSASELRDLVLSPLVKKTDHAGFNHSQTDITVMRQWRRKHSPPQMRNNLFHMKEWIHETYCLMDKLDRYSCSDRALRQLGWLYRALFSILWLNFIFLNDGHIFILGIIVCCGCALEFSGFSVLCTKVPQSAPKVPFMCFTVGKTIFLTNKWSNKNNDNFITGYGKYHSLHQSHSKWVTNYVTVTHLISTLNKPYVTADTSAPRTSNM